MPNPKGHEESIKDSRFKAAWQSGPTRTIRVPIALADATLEYARQLDQRGEPHDTAKKRDAKTDAISTEPLDTRKKSNVKTDTNSVEPRDTMPQSGCCISSPAVKADDARIAKQPHERLFGMWKRCKLDVASLRQELAEAHTYQEQIEAQLSELKQNSAPVAQLSEKLTFDAATILSKLRAKRKKSKADLADLEAILEILGS